MRIYQELEDEVFQIMAARLPAYLTYHTPEHTAYVVEQAELICRQENVNGHDLYLVKIAALFHDIGFIRQNDHHEDKGCEICTERLKQYEFPEEDIDKICGMIQATKIPQQPKTLNEKIVADADLEYLGTDMFYTFSQNLFHEFRHFDPALDQKRFNEIQVNFIRKHTYHTDYCKTFREEKKQQHLKEILDSLKKIL